MTEDMRGGPPSVARAGSHPTGTRARAAQDLADLAPIDQTLEKEHHERTKVKNIQVIELGRYEVRRALSPPARRLASEAEPCRRPSVGSAAGLAENVRTCLSNYSGRVVCVTN